MFKLFGLVVALSLLGCVRNEKISGAEWLEEAQIEDYPFIVSISYFYNEVVEHFCNGIIVDRNYVLTTNTCLLYRPAQGGEYRIINGLRDLRDFNNSIDASTLVAEIIPYPTAQYAINDIALLRVLQPLDFTDVVQPAVLPNATFSLTAASTILTYSFEELYTAEVELRDSDECLEDTFEINVPISPTLHICSVIPGNLTGIDPGMEAERVKPMSLNAPTPRLSLAQCVSAFRSAATALIQQNEDGENVVVGISTWGVGECNSYTPTISANVEQYLDFIDEVRNRPIPLVNTV